MYGIGDSVRDHEPRIGGREITTLGEWTGLMVDFKDNSGLEIAMAAGGRSLGSVVQ